MPPRRSALDRVPGLIDAAVLVFAEKGYRATQMTDGAESMGVAAGSLDNYVDSKDGLFALCLEQMIQAGSPPRVTLPFLAPTLDAVVTELFDIFSRTRLALDMIERSARDLPAALVRDEWRAPLLARTRTSSVRAWTAASSGSPVM
jgi:AcrR family transcriptional regulator